MPRQRRVRAPGVVAASAPLASGRSSNAGMTPSGTPNAAGRPGSARSTRESRRAPRPELGEGRHLFAPDVGTRGSSARAASRPAPPLPVRWSCACWRRPPPAPKRPRFITRCAPRKSVSASARPRSAGSPACVTHRRCAAHVPDRADRRTGSLVPSAAPANDRSGARPRVATATSSPEDSRRSRARRRDARPSSSTEPRPAAGTAHAARSRTTNGRAPGGQCTIREERMSSASAQRDRGQPSATRRRQRRTPAGERPRPVWHCSRTASGMHAEHASTDGYKFIY